MPVWIAVGPTGTVYVSDQQRRVQAFDAYGGFLFQLGDEEPGADAGVISGRTTAIATDAAGNLMEIDHAEKSGLYTIQVPEEGMWALRAESLDSTFEQNVVASISAAGAVSLSASVDPISENQYLERLVQVKLETNVGTPVLSAEVYGDWVGPGGRPYFSSAPARVVNHHDMEKLFRVPLSRPEVVQPIRTSWLDRAGMLR